MVPPAAGTPHAAPIQLCCGAATDIGRVRARNEDRYVADVPLQLFAVVDGMGGHASGELASATVADAVTAFIRDTAADSDKTLLLALDGRLSVLANRLQVAVQSANRALAARAQADAALGGSGATLAAALFEGDDVAISHVGDCRAYLLRQGDLMRLTRDHSLVAEQMALGLIDDVAARTHPLRHVVTRAVAGRPEMTVDVVETKVDVGDRIFLCSDGIHGVLTDKEIASLIGEDCPLGTICQAVIDAANARGGPDNCTAVLVEVGAAASR